MSKLKIEKGASKIRREPLKVTIDGSIGDDLKLMCDWSENDLSYVVNLLLGFAIAQSEEFQRYKAGRLARGLQLANETTGIPFSAKAATDLLPKTDSTPASRS